MSTITEVTQKGQEQFLEAVRESQQAVVDAVGAWAQTVQGLSGGAPAVAGAAHHTRPQEVIVNTFDLVEKLLAGQREFARNLLAAATPAVKPSTPSAAKSK